MLYMVSSYRACQIERRNTMNFDNHIPGARHDEAAECEALEKLVDANGLFGVLKMLSEVCHAKADHIAHNWQDTALANMWDNWAISLDHTAGRAKRDGV